MEFREQSVEDVCQRLVHEAKSALEVSNWRIGELAVEWVAVTGKTDAQFGEYLGLSKKQVQQRRLVWELFGVRKEFREGLAGLTWTHFRIALGWDDADDCLKWAADAEATVNEMIMWRKASHGEPLTGVSQNSLMLEPVADAEVPDDDEKIFNGAESPVVPVRAKQETGQQNSSEDIAAGDRQESAESRKADKPDAKPRKPSGSSKPRENVRQPRSVDEKKFDLLDELSHVMSQLRDLAAPFYAADRLEDYVRAVRSHVDEITAEIKRQQER